MSNPKSARLGLVARYKVGIFDASDAEFIIGVTGKRARYDNARAAAQLNIAISLAISRVSISMAAPPSEQARRVDRLARALRDALGLMMMDVDTPPTNADKVNAIQILFPYGAARPDDNAMLGKLGIKSEIEAAELEIVGLWSLHLLATGAHRHWSDSLRGRMNAVRQTPARWRGRSRWRRPMKVCWSMPRCRPSQQRKARSFVSAGASARRP